MRPPTRSTRSVRTLSNPPTTNVRRRSRGASLGPLAISETSDDPPRPKPQSPIITTAAAPAPATTGGGGAEVDSSSTSLESEPAALASAPIVGCFPALPPATTFVFENQNSHHHHHHPPDSELPLVGPNVCTTAFGKPPRSRQRLSSDKLGALDAFFRRNTHPTRKEKEAICKDLDMDLKTVTIWFQNKRQTLARSRKLLESEGGAVTSTAAMDILASTSATMPPLLSADAAAAFAIAEKPYTSSSSSSSSASASAPVQLGSSTREPYRDYLSPLDQATPRLPHAQATITPHGPVPKSCLLATPRVPLSAVAHDPNVFESVLAEVSSSSSPCVSSPSPDLRRPRFGHNWSIHPEDLWKHIPSSPAQPALSSPDVSPDIDTPSRGSRFSVQRPRTLEWACARSAKRRRTNPDAVQDEDRETDGEYNSVDRSVACRSSFSISEARVPLECYDKYPLDVVRGAVLLLGLRDSKRGLGI